ncbi:hypothetical protein PMAYCL1PPCAC_06834, partial [Pristionchus mayeri]
STTTLSTTTEYIEKRAKFPTPPSIEKFIEERKDTVEGSGFEEEFKEREQRREIKRRDTDTLDMDISSPELTILERELVESGTPLPRALSSSSPSTDSVCVPVTAFWLLVGLVLLSLSAILAAIYKASSKSGFVQF